MSYVLDQSGSLWSRWLLRSPATSSASRDPRDPVVGASGHPLRPWSSEAGRRTVSGVEPCDGDHGRNRLVLARSPLPSAARDRSVTRRSLARANRPSHQQTTMSGVVHSSGRSERSCHDRLACPSPSAVCRLGFPGMAAQLFFIVCGRC